MAQPTYGAPWDPLADVYGQHWVFEPLTSDPSSTTEGDLWLRDDLDAGAKMATVRFDHGSGVWDLPVIPLGEADGSVEEVLRVQTANGLGFVPADGSNPAFPQLGFQHNGSALGLHNSAVGIPATATVQFSAWTFSTGDGTWDDGVGGNDMAINGDPQTATLLDSSQSVSADGTDDSGSFSLPSSLSGTGLQQSAIEISLQTEETANNRVLGYDAGGSALYLMLNRGEDFATEDGNFNLFLEDDSGNEAVVSPAFDPGLNDGARHDVTVIINDITAYDVDLIVDGVPMQTEVDERGNPAPTTFSLGDIGVFAYNDGNGFADHADVDVGLLRLHDQAISEQTVGDMENLTLRSHQRHSLSLLPMAHHYNGTTYVTYGDVDELGADNEMHIIVGALDHATGAYTTTDVGQVYAENHYLGAVTVDSNGDIWIAYDWRGSGGVGDGGESIIAKSDASEDISSFTQVYSNSVDRNYAVWGNADGDHHLFVRGGPDTSHYALYVTRSEDGGSTWTEDELVDVANLWLYPSEAYVDGTDVHLVIRGRSQTTDPDIAAHVVYDTENKTLRGTDGTDLPAPASKSDLANADSIIASSTTWAGAHSVVVDGGNPRVVYLEDSDLKFAEYAGGSWNTSVVDALPGISSSALISESNGSDIEIIETIYSSLNNTNNLGLFTSNDGGISWSSRSVARDFENWPFGPGVVKTVRGSGPAKAIALQQTDLNNAQSANAQVKLLDDAFEDIDITH